MTDHSPDLSSLFLAAVELSSDSEREEFLDRSCGEDAELRKQLELLLSVRNRADGFLSSPPPEFAATDINAQSAVVDRPSLLKSLGVSSPVSQVALKEPAAEEDDPILRPSSPEMPQTDADSRYQLQGEIARGGMGAVMLGRDSDLGRTLAVKVLLESHKDKPQIVQRFVEEAQIGGQLQHPGIAPVYDIGQFSDERPFFSMKLVKGQTLASLLTERTGSTEERGRFLGIFEQICQTMAYAHSRGVVHRDLKPANVMVGAFGEVQVMDWGLAKVLSSGGVADERKTRDAILGQSMVQTLRSMGSDAPGTVGTVGSVGSDTQIGSVMGTPAYMPPEQALGEVDRLDERCDVFALGSMLCEILTGQPPYVHEDHREVYRMATRGKLEDCFQRLDACGADAELISLAKQCLELEPADRPRNAGVLAERVAAYLESVEARLRETELQRAAEAAKAVEERKRRKVTWALAASIMLIFTFGGGSWMWASHQQAERRTLANQQVTDALAEAKVHQGLAKTADLKVRLEELKSGMTYAQQAIALSEVPDADKSHRDSAGQLLAVLQEAHEQTTADVQQAEKEQRLLAQIELIRVTHADEGSRINVGDEAVRANPDETSRRFGTAFREAGYHFARTNTDEAAKQIRKSKNREALIAGVDHWLRTIPEPGLRARLQMTMNSGEWSEAAEVARESLKADLDNSQIWLTLAAMLLLMDDRDGYEMMCHEMLEQFSGRISGEDAGRIVKVCLQLAGVIDVESLPTQSLIDAQEAGIDSFWETRALLAYRNGDAKSALEFIAKVKDIKSQSFKETFQAFNLCVASMALHELGKDEQAQEKLNQARELIEEQIQRRKFIPPTGLTLIVLREAETALNDKSVGDWIKRFQSALAQNDARSNRGERIQRREKLLEIVNAADDNSWRISLRKALAENDTPRLLELAANDNSRQLSPELASWLGAALREAKEYDRAVEILKREQPKHPGDFWINFELSLCLQKQRKWEAALGYARAALAVRPDSTSAAWILVTALDDAGQEEEALQLFKGMLSRTEMSAGEYISMSEYLRHRGWYDYAELTLRQVIDKAPENAYTHARALDRLSLTLSEQGKDAEALEFARKLREVDPDYESGYFRLAYALTQENHQEEAAKVYRDYLELRPNNLVALNNLGNTLGRLEQWEEASEVLERALKIDPNYTYAQRTLRNVLNTLARQARQQGDFAAARLTRDKLEQFGLEESDGKLIQESRDTLELNPRDNDTRYKLGSALLDDDQIEQAIEQFEIMLQYNPDSAIARHGLGECYKIQGDIDAAIAEYREAVELDRTALNHRVHLAGALHQKALGSSGGTRTLPSLIFDAGAEVVSKPLLEEAVLEYRRAIALKEDSESDPPILLLEALALAYDQLGQPEKAKEIREQLPEEGPVGRRSEAIRTALELRREGMIDEAIEMLEQALQDDPQATRIVIILGNLYKSLKRYDEALATYRKLLDSDANSGHNTISSTLRAVHRYEEAHQFLKDALAADASLQDRHEFQAALGSVLMDRGEIEAALGHFRKALELRTFGPALEAKSGIVWALLQQEKLDEAEAECRELWDDQSGNTRYHPLDHVFMNKSLAWCELSRYDLSGDAEHLKKAVQHARQGCEQAENQSRGFSVRVVEDPCLLPMGICQYRKKDFSQALENLEKAYEKVEYDPHTWVFLAMTHWKLDRKDEARRWLAKVDKHVQEHKTLPTLKRYLDEAKKLIR